MAGFLRQADVRDPEITRLAACAADLVRARPQRDAEAGRILST